MNPALQYAQSASAVSAQTAQTAKNGGIALPATDLIYYDLITYEQAEKVLKEVQKLEPPGIGSRTVQECLMTQLKAVQQPTVTQKLALAVLLIEIPVLVAEQFIGVVFQATGLVNVAPLAFLFIISAVEMLRFALQLGVFLAAYPQFVRETV